MTSSSPGDSMTSLHPDDLFLVNRDVDGSNINFETYKVPYSEVSKAFKGDTGSEGPAGPTGPQGSQGDPGTSVKVLGSFEDYTQLQEKATDDGPGGSNTLEEGDIYVVYDDWSDSSWPGQKYCKKEQDGTPIVEAANCQINVAYVWAIKADGTNDMFVRLGPLTGDRGSTGPHYNEVIGEADDQTATNNGKYNYKITFKDNKDYQDDPSGYTGLDDQELLIEDIQGATGSTGPYYDTIFTSVDTLEEDGEDDQGNTKYKKDYRITFAPSDASDPDGVLAPFETLNLIGATGPGVGEKGPTGPSFDIVEHREGDPEIDPNDTLLSYTEVYVDYKDSKGVLAEQRGTVNVKGPRGPSGPPMDPDIFKDFLLEIFPPDAGVDDDAPWVHKGKNCGGGTDNVDEPIYGTKTFKKTLKFAPCSFNQEIIRWDLGDSNRDFRMFFMQDEGTQRLDGFILKRANNTNPGLIVGFEKGSAGSAQVGIKCNPAVALDVKGPAHANNFVARAAGDAGKNPGTRTMYGLGSMESSKNQFYWRGLSGHCEHVFQGTTKIYIQVGANNFKIAGGSIGSRQGYTLKRNNDGSVCRNNTHNFQIPSSSESQYALGELQDKNVALGIVKLMKPRRVTVETETFVTPLTREDLPTDAFDRMAVTFSEDGAKDASMEGILSLLVLSIQKLEERISALESA